MLAAGALGTLTYGRVRLSHDGATAGWLPERFYDPATAVGGALTDLGCHPVYLIQRWLGARPERVSATYGSVTGRAVEDHAVVTAGYADGRIGVIETGFVSRDPYAIELHGTDGRPALPRPARRAADPRRHGVEHAARGAGRRGRVRPLGRPHARRDPRRRQPGAGRRAHAPGRRRERGGGVGPRGGVLTPLRVGLIGGGGIADEHIRGYRAHADRIVVAAVADLDAATAARRAAELGAAPFADVDALLAGADVDAIDICLPHHLHKDAIVAAARAGKHVLCEKPLCLTAAEAAEVRAAVAEAGITLMCAHNQLFLPAVAAAKALLAGGALGTVYEVRTTDSFHNDFDPDVDGLAGERRHERRRRADRHGLSPLLPDAPPRGRRAGGGHRDALHAPAAVHGGRGLRAGPRALRQRRRRPPGDELGLRPGAGDGALLGRRRARLAAQRRDDAHARAAVGRDRRPRRSIPVDMFAAEIGHFADCLLEGRRPLHTEHEGIEVLGLILAAYESARRGIVAPVLRA